MPGPAHLLFTASCLVLLLIAAVGAVVGDGTAYLIGRRFGPAVFSPEYVGRVSYPHSLAYNVVGGVLRGIVIPGLGYGLGRLIPVGLELRQLWRR